MSDNNQSSMNLLGNRLAKSLLRFLKPIRFTIGRLPEDPKPPHHQSQFQGNILSLTAGGGKSTDEIDKAIEKDKKRKHTLRLVSASNAEDAPSQALSEETDAALLATASPLPERAPAHWLDLVIFLINACKRASSKLRVKKGVQNYQAAASSRGQARIKSIGSIIDTTTIIKDAEEDEKESEPETAAPKTGAVVDKKAA